MLSQIVTKVLLWVGGGVVGLVTLLILYVGGMIFKDWLLGLKKAVYRKILAARVLFYLRKRITEPIPVKVYIRSSSSDFSHTVWNVLKAELAEYNIDLLEWPDNTVSFSEMARDLEMYYLITRRFSGIPKRYIPALFTELFVDWGRGKQTTLNPGIIGWLSDENLPLNTKEEWELTQPVAGIDPERFSHLISRLVKTSAREIALRTNSSLREEKTRLMMQAWGHKRADVYPF